LFDGVDERLGVGETQRKHGRDEREGRGEREGEGEMRVEKRFYGRGQKKKEFLIWIG
jgi:hypothetical protein